MAKLLLFTSILMLVISCRGPQVNTVLELEYGDYQKNCEEIENEILILEKKAIPKVKRKIRLKRGKNTLFYIASPFTFFIPLLFLSSTDEQKDKIESYYQRLEHLYYLKERQTCESQN